MEEQGQEDYQPFYGKDEEMKTNVKVRFDHSLTDNYEVEKTGEFTRPRDTRGHGSPSIFEPGAPDGGHLEELCGKVCLRNGREGPTGVRGGAAGEHGRAAGEGVRGVRAVVQERGGGGGEAG